MVTPGNVTPGPMSSAEDVLRSLGATREGLSSPAAAERLARYGRNEPAATGETAWHAILPVIADPLLLLLIAASGVSAVVGQVTDAVLIIAMVTISVALNFAQTYRSKRAADRLRENVAITATARRDQTWKTVPRAEIVPGDVIRLAAGALIPADAQLLVSRDLHVYEAALTGESMPAEKDAAPGEGADGEERRNLLFMGTSVISGTAEAIVLRTGAATMFGDIVARVAATRPETEFDRGTREFSAFISKTIVVLIVFVLLSGVLSHRDPLQSLLFALALAVGLAPEFLPMIRTVTLGRGAMRMARQRVIVKHLSAIQDFGSMDVLCSDKTGTLTTGIMTVEKSVDPLGTVSETPLRLAALNAALESGIDSPLDAAILRALTPTPLPLKIDEIPFDFERRMVSVVVEDGKEHLLIVKGAPENVVSQCTAAHTSEGVLPLDKQKVLDLAESLSMSGARVLAVAQRAMTPRSRYTRDDEHDLQLLGFIVFRDPPLPNVAAAVAALEADGVTLKILTGDGELVASHLCQALGVLAAGTHLEAKALARPRAAGAAGRAGPGIGTSAILLGRDIEKMTDGALAAAAEGAIVFARLTPAQKTRIVLALKSRGHVVGFMGDGINDAPSLRAADVGISVANAVDVAREAADVILLDRGLDVLHRGIREGRKAFGNLMKYLLMETSSNFGNMFSMAAAALFLPFLPMLPTQVLLNNFLYDLSQVAIPTDHVDAAYMQNPQRWNIAFLRRFMLIIGPISSLFDFATFWLLLVVFHARAATFQTGWFVESLTTQTLVLFVIRTASNPFRSRPSAPLLITGILVVVVALVLPCTTVGSWVGLVPLSAPFYAFLLAVTASYLAIVEVVKRRVMTAL
jgi:Mg2+-importing ATPase